METPKSTDLSGWADIFFRNASLLMASIQLAGRSTGTAAELGKIMEEHAGWGLKHLDQIRFVFNEELKRIDSKRLHDAYLKRGEIPKAKWQLGTENSHSEALSQDLNFFFDSCIEGFNILLKEEGKSPIRAKTITDLLGSFSSMSAEHQFYWWLALSKYLSRITGLERDLKRLSDANTRSETWRWFHWLRSPGTVSLQKWQQRIAGIKIEEAMLRVDYPELFVATGQQAEGPGPENRGATARTRGNYLPV